MSQCLDRETLLLVAAGACPFEQRADVGRHLRGGEKCRKAVAGIASGARLGDTAEDAPAIVVPSSRRASKSLPVLASVLAVAVAFLVGAPNQRPSLPSTPTQPIVFALTAKATV